MIKTGDAVLRRLTSLHDYVIQLGLFSALTVTRTNLTHNQSF